MANLLLVLVALATTSIAHGQVISTGRCPDVSGIAAFTPAAYVGKWYEISKYPAASEIGECIKAEYSMAEDGTTVNVKNTQRILGLSNSVEGTGVVSSDDGTGQLDITFTMLGISSPTATIYILDTDYSSYSITYSCTNLGLLKAENVWILSRTKEMTTAATATVNTYIAAHEDLIDADRLDEQDQSDATCTAEN